MPYIQLTGLIPSTTWLPRVAPGGSAEHQCLCSPQCHIVKYLLNQCIQKLNVFPQGLYILTTITYVIKCAVNYRWNQIKWTGVVQESACNFERKLFISKENWIDLDNLCSDPEKCSRYQECKIFLAFIKPLTIFSHYLCNDILCS